MRACAGLLLLSVLVCLGCSGPPVDLAKGLEIQNVSTGWFDAGIQNGQNKLVPSISFAVKNVSDQRLRVLDVNTSFRRVTEEKEEWAAEFKAVTGWMGLAPRATTESLVFRSRLGYTGSDQSREEMLTNSRFVDAVVEVSAKYGSTQFQRIGVYPIDRRLITK